MLKNYIKVTLRHIQRHKGYAFINVFGLAIGMSCCILILSWVKDELNYNLFHEKVDQIFRINKKYQIGTETSYNPSTPYPLAQAAREKYATVLDATKYYRTSVLLRQEDKIFHERRVCAADSSFFKIFTFPFLKGDPRSALTNPNAIVLTDATAKKYFGDLDPIGRVVTLDNRIECTISGVIQDIPSNSDLQFDIFVSIKSMDRPEYGDDWRNHWLRTFILVQSGAQIEELEQKLSAMIQEQLPEEKISLTLQSLKHIHLYTIDGKMAGMKYVYFFTAIAIFILTIACINFINLSTARSEKRAKEVGLRKVSGAKRPQIALQFLGESVIFTLIALAMAVLLVEFIKPAFNAVTGKNLIIDYSNSTSILYLILITLFAGFISGSYPALFLSSFQPIKALKGAVGTTHKNKSFRNILVIIQFSISIILLIGTSIIFNQIRYMQQKDPGYNKENILCLRMNDDVRKNYEIMKQELLQYPGIEGITRTSELPTEIWSIMRGIKWEGKQSNEGAAFGFAAVDHDYIETMKLELVQGRNFSIKYPTDSSNFILNEKAIQIMGMKDPIGKLLNLDEDNKGTIIGVVKDFYFLPLTYAMEPLMLMIHPDYYREVLIKIQSGDMNETIRYIKNVWKKIASAYPFEYHFLDEGFDIIYSHEVRAGMIFRYFVVLAIFISCLGLLGLASFTAEQKTKEIGIRKVLGASSTGIILLLIKEYSKWVILSNIIAWPIAYFFMNKWLQNFAYRVDITWVSFVGAGITALIIAIATVSFQSIKAAVENPAKSLMHE